MCLLENFCCCFSLRTGMKWITSCYLVYFIVCSTDSRSRPAVDNPFEIYLKSNIEVFRLYVFCGFIVSVVALFGALRERRAMAYPLFIYEIFLLIFRIFSYVGDNSVYATQNAMPVIVIQIYLMWLELSYLREEPPTVYIPVIHPPTTSIVINNQPMAVSAPPPMMCPYPVAYAQPVAYPQPMPMPSAQPYPQMYMPQNVDASLANQQTTQPFPYDAPPPYAPPYAEKQGASAPPQL